MKLPANSASNWFKWAPRKERLLAAELIAQSLEQVDISEGELRKAGLPNFDVGKGKTKLVGVGTWRIIPVDVSG